MNHSDEFHYCTLPRKVAKERGIRTFFMAKPCRHGNVYPRAVAGYHCKCNDCLADSRKSAKNYFYSNKEKCLDRARNWKSGNRDRVDAYTAKWRKDNKDRLKKYEKDRYEGDKEYQNERCRVYKRSNPHVRSANQASRKAAKINRTLDPSCELTQFVMEEAAELCRTHEKMHGVKFHVDHMIPMQGEMVSGLHVGWNLQVLPATLNVRKGNRPMYTEPFEWVRDAHMVQ